MPAKDFYHDAVVNAIIAEGWEVTHDPYILPFGTTKLYVDIGAEKDIIGAKKGKEYIAIEVKSFLGKSDIDQFEDALGQYLIYYNLLATKDPDRKLYLGVPLFFYERFLDQSFFHKLIKDYNLSILVYNPKTEKIELWIK